jgi:hypothetical protein
LTGVEWIKKENEKRKRLGLNLIEENAFKHETIKLDVKSKLSG